MNPIANYPPELIAAVVEGAERDADFAAAFLDACGFAAKSTADLPVRFSPEFLLNLGAALRLLRWESAGLDLHLQAGLPAAKEMVVEVIEREATETRGGEVAYSAGTFCRQVFVLSVEQLAWTAPRILGTEVALGRADEDQLVEVVAQLLWACRNHGGHNGTKE